MAVFKLITKLAKRIKEEYNDSIDPDELKKLNRLAKKNNTLSYKDKLDKAFNYVNKADSPQEGKSRAQEMFGDFVDVDNLIKEEVGDLSKAFTKPREKPVNSMTQLRNLKTKLKTDKPKKMKKGGMVTKWESKWG